MNFIKNLNIGESLTATSAQRDTLKISRGFLVNYEIRLTSGTDVTTLLKILYHGTQILPSNREESLKVSNIFHRMPAIQPLLDPPFELEFSSTNSAESHNYVSVALLIVEPELMDIYSGYAKA